MPHAKGVLTLLVLVFFAGCGSREAIEVSLLPNEHQPAEITAVDEDALSVGIAAVLSPKEMFVYYNDLLNHMGEKLSKPVVMKHGSYERINELLRSGGVDMAFICSGAYVAAREEFGLDLLAVPVMGGETVYYSYIIVPDDSPAEDFMELEGKSFAFVDPLSNSGYLFPVELLNEGGKVPTRFFSRIIFTRSHDNSIIAAAERLVDGAAVNSLVYDMFAAENPGLAGRVRIILVSPPFGIPPLVVPPATDSRTREKLEAFFLGLHQDEKGSQILGDLKIDRFVPPEDGMYDSIPGAVR